MQNPFQQFFSFSRSERNGALALLGLIGLLIIVPRVYIYMQPAGVVNADATTDKEMQAFAAQYTDSGSLKNDEKPSTASSTNCFEFDPNTISESDWQKLGFSAKQAKAIEKYKTAGGHFYRPEDLKRVYVIGEENYVRIAPCIKILPTKASLTNEIELNTAGYEVWVAQPGVTPTLAKRIVNYRRALGGYYSVSQLSEVWDMPDSIYRTLAAKCKPGKYAVTKLNVNTATKEELNKHPYIDNKVATDIYNYRERQGPFKSISDLKKVALVNDSIFGRLQPYLKTED